MPQRASQRKFGKSLKLHLAKQKTQKLEETWNWCMQKRKVYRERAFVLKKRKEKASRRTREKLLICLRMPQRCCKKVLEKNRPKPNQNKTVTSWRNCDGNLCVSVQDRFFGRSHSQKQKTRGWESLTKPGVKRTSAAEQKREQRTHAAPKNSSSLSSLARGYKDGLQPRLWLMAIGWWININQCRKLKLNLTQTWGVCMSLDSEMHWSQNQWYCDDKLRKE